MRQILELVRASIFDSSRGPVYLHCWNGWHASGLASAIILRQFCDTSPETAVNYWIRNTDGNNSGFAGIKNHGIGQVLMAVGSELGGSDHQQKECRRAGLQIYLPLM